MIATPPAAPRNDTGPRRLTPAQEAAVARVGWAVTDRDLPAAAAPVVLLCGPTGVGKTTVLNAVRDGLAVTRLADLRTAADWIEILGTRGIVLPEIVIADDAHEASCGDLLRLVAAVHGRHPRGRLVLSGEGRLLSIVARDGRIEQAVGMRAVLRPFTAADTRAVVAGMLGSGDTPTAGGHEDPLAEAARTIHEIAGGMPGAVLRITRQAAFMADARPDRRLTAADIELVHGRLSLTAA